MLEEKLEAKLDALMAIDFERLCSRQEAQFLAVQQERLDLYERRKRRRATKKMKKRKRARRSRWSGFLLSCSS